MQQNSVVGVGRALGFLTISIDPLPRLPNCLFVGDCSHHIGMNIMNNITETHTRPENIAIFASNDNV